MFTPYPGTPFYEKNKAQLLTNNYEDFTQYKLVYKHNNFTPDSARKELGMAYTKYYLGRIFN